MTKQKEWGKGEGPQPPKPAAEVEVTRDKGALYIEVRLTPDELKAAGKALADAIQRKCQTEDRVESFKAQAKAEIAQLDALVARNSALVNNEKEFRNVPCEINFNWTTGVKSFYRIDNGEFVKDDRITDDERQIHFTK